MASGEVEQTIQESGLLADTLGINGTPGYVVGDAIVPGAIGAAGQAANFISACPS